MCIMKLKTSESTSQGKFKESYIDCCVTSSRCMILPGQLGK
jgi:hypothetical protein